MLQEKEKKYVATSPQILNKLKTNTISEDFI